MVVTRSMRKRFNSLSQFELNAVQSLILMKQQPIQTIPDIKICYLDFETTGINPYIDSIVEVGIHGTLGDHQWLIKQNKDIPRKAYQTHKINKQMTQKYGISNKESAFKKYEILKQYDYCLTYNGIVFDIPMLVANLDKYGLEVPKNLKFIDVMLFIKKHMDRDEIERRIFKSCKKNIQDHRGTYQLSNVYQIYKTEDVQAHRALEDCKMTKDVFVGVLKDKNIKMNKENMDLIAEEQAKDLNLQIRQ